VSIASIADDVIERIRADTSYLDHYREHGYAVIRSVFTPDEIAELHEACARMRERGLGYPATFRHGNVVFWRDVDHDGTQLLRGMQWPAYLDASLDALRGDPRMLAIVEPLIGNDLKQIINQIHWKARGSGTQWPMHQDVRSRKPSWAFRELGDSYVQTGLAVERHDAHNGALRVIPGSHRLPDLHDYRAELRIDDAARRIAATLDVDLDRYVELHMEPGDIGIWHPYTIHGSGPNVRGDNHRLIYINGYVRADNCDRGHWVFCEGRSVPLGDPVRVQYEGLYSNPDPHYPGGEVVSD